MIALATEPIEQVPQKGIEVVSVADLTAASLESAGAAEALAFISMMKDEENLEVCRAAYEQFGTRSLDRPFSGPRLLGALQGSGCDRGGSGVGDGEPAGSLRALTVGYCTADGHGKGTGRDRVRGR